jgi:hypothetical protein
MLFYLYLVCLSIFFLQGIALPFLVIGAGLLWWRHARELDRLEKGLAASRRKRGASAEDLPSVLAALPKLRPLTCDRCGGNVLLRAADTECAHCRTRGDLPEDYAAANALRRRLKRLLTRAIRHWRVANVLTHPLVGGAFFLLIFAEPLVLFPAVLVGSGAFPDTWMDRTLESLGATAGMFVAVPAFLGVIVWMVVFISLAALSKSLRRQLPVRPVLRGATRRREAASCQACGGGVEYDPDAFACLCGYCNVENFRVRFARRERTRSEARTAEAGFMLFGAMEIIDDFVGTFFFTALILVGASVVLVVIQAIAK